MPASDEKKRALELKLAKAFRYTEKAFDSEARASG
tara:strand:+ start:161 stop:265 length:105 start_codon:yes stop_codon:yes gene_type:complete